MKIIGQLLLVTFVVATLTTYDEQGKDRMRPKVSSPTHLYLGG
jgi:hypothetical protein